MVQQVTSTPNLILQRSLLTTLIHKSDQASARQNAALRFVLAVHWSLELNDSIDFFSQKMFRNFYSCLLWLTLIIIVQYCLFTVAESKLSMQNLTFNLSKFFPSSSLDYLKSSRLSQTCPVPPLLSCFSALSYYTNYDSWNTSPQ